MAEQRIGVLAAIGACVIWGLSPIYYKALAHVPPPEVLAHRAIWSLVFFCGVLALQSRLPELLSAMYGRRRLAILAVASLMITINWFLFIFAIQIGRTTEASLGYYIFPLVAVLIGRLAFGEALGRPQWIAVGVAAAAVALLTAGLGVAPWISLVLAVTFGLYGAIKKQLPVGPVVSVTCEILLFAPFAIALLAWAHWDGQGAFGSDGLDTALLILSGPLTATPLILFSVAARRISLASLGLLNYINPTLQFFCAVAIFAEPFSGLHAVVFAMIWVALALFSLSAWRQERAARRLSMASVGVSTTVSRSNSDASAKP